MVDIDGSEAVTAAAGEFGAAMTTMTGTVGSAVTDDLVLHSRADSPLGRALTELMGWMQRAVDNAIRETNSQAGTTFEVTSFAAGTLANADIDGAAEVRRAAL